jgi:homoserine O-acetyltransferase
VEAGRDVAFANIESNLGHDDFLMPIPQYHAVLGRYLERVAMEVGA